MITSNIQEHTKNIIYVKKAKPIASFPTLVYDKVTKIKTAIASINKANDADPIGLNITYFSLLSDS